MILLLKTYHKWFLCYHLPCSLKIFLNVFAFPYVKAKFKEICKANILSIFFRKMLMSAFLLSFKANYLEKMRSYPNFSLWIPTALARIYFLRVVLAWRKNLCI